MSTLDQAFIRAYNKDRKAPATNAPNAAQAANATQPENTARTAPHSVTATAHSYPTPHASAFIAEKQDEADAPAEAGRWYRVDAAGNLHTRHQRLGEVSEPVYEEPIASPNMQVIPETIRTENSSGAMQSRHAGHRLPPYPHMNSNANTATAETVSVAASHSGRRTLASYLAQNPTTPAVDSINDGLNDSPLSHPETSKNAAAKPITNLSGSSTQPMPPPASPQSSVRIDTQSPPAPASFRSTAPAHAKAAIATQANSMADVKAIAPSENPSISFEDAKPARTISQEAARSTLKMPAVGHFRTTRTDRPAVQETETAKTKFAAVPFQAAWEVDSLSWPEIQATLLHEQDRAFSKVAAHFCDACHQGLQVLIVTSPTQEEGRSTVASCIARSVAQRGIRVALLDGDIESPSLADSLNLEIAQGWNDAIVEGLPLEEIAIHSIEDQLTLIPLTAHETSPKLAHIDRYIAAVLERLRESFDLIVIDATFINSLDNRLIGTEANETIDAMILVTDGRIDDQQRIETAVRRIKNLGISSVGIVENFTNS
jgi:Mrp family chromosome partitioning ATPase